MPNTFTFAGWSRLSGKVKVRYANDMLRVKTLEKNGHSEIVLLPTGAAMSKLEVCNWLINEGHTAGNDEAHTAATAEMARLQAKESKGSKAAPAEPTAAAEPEIEVLTIVNEDDSIDEDDDGYDDDYDAVAEEGEEFEAEA